ncbi:MAG TPA: FHA domain-containing protein [Blastocatellia bacterium]|nr:FHA domain-containing protein [Blastocatellia bacterium]
MIRCNNCGTNNIDGSEYCDECGTRLDLAAPPGSNARNPSEPPAYRPPSAVSNDPVSSHTIESGTPAPPSFTTSTSMPKPAMPARGARERDNRAPEGNNDSPPRLLSRRRDEAPERQAVSRSTNERRPNDPPRHDSIAPPQSPSKTFVLSSRGRTDSLQSEQPGAASADASTNVRINARLLIERGGRIGKEFPITGIETNIGRWDADGGIFPDVDLDEDDPEAKISRRHARIINHNGQYFIEDLGSTNGTFVNRGRRLLPGKRHMLQNGDEIIVGKTFLKFQILR